MADTFGLKIGLEGEKEFKAQLKELLRPVAWQQASLYLR